MSGGNVVIATFKTKTVGIQFAVNDGFARTHDVLAMDRGRLNPHDWHAVRVWEPLDCQLGHLKQSVGKLMDEEDMSVVGYALSGRPTGYRWGKDYGIETIIICTGPPGSCATVLEGLRGGGIQFSVDDAPALAAPPAAVPATSQSGTPSRPPPAQRRRVD